MNSLANPAYREAFQKANAAEIIQVLPFPATYSMAKTSIADQGISVVVDEKFAHLSQQGLVVYWIAFLHRVKLDLPLQELLDSGDAASDAELARLAEAVMASLSNPQS